MPNRNYQRGAALERQWCADKEAEGYVTFRIAGSRGTTDCVAVAPGDLIFAQCKSGGRSRFEGFPPADRKALAEEADAAGARALLVRRFKGQKGYEELPPSEWPEARQNGSGSV